MIRILAFGLFLISLSAQATDVYDCIEAQQKTLAEAGKQISGGLDCSLNVPTYTWEFESGSNTERKSAVFCKDATKKEIIVYETARLSLDTTNCLKQTASLIEVNRLTEDVDTRILSCNATLATGTSIAREIKLGSFVIQDRNYQNSGVVDPVNQVSITCNAKYGRNCSSQGEIKTSMATAKVGDLSVRLIVNTPSGDKMIVGCKEMDWSE